MIKKLLTVLLLSFLIFSCKNETEPSPEPLPEISNKELASYTSVGEKFSPNNALSAKQMHQRYSQLKAGDTIKVKFTAPVNSVCKNKGCWMKLDLVDGAEAMVEFKDYAFFVPKDIEEKEVIVFGKAYISETSVEEQRHFATDAGKSPEEVAAIRESQKTLAFLAEGVLIKP